MTVHTDYSKLNELMKQNGLIMQTGKVFPVSFTPYLIDEKRYLKLQQQCESLLSAIEIFTNFYVKQNKNFFHEIEYLRPLIEMPSVNSRTIQYARFDFIEKSNGDFKILEPNCACPGGILVTPVIKSVLKKIETHNNLVDKLSVVIQDTDCTDFFFKFLIDLYRSQGGREVKPTIAYINSEFRTVTSDLNQFMDIGRDLGLNVIRAYTQGIEYKNGSAYYQGHKIDIGHSKHEFFIDENGKLRPTFFTKKLDEAKGYLDSIKNNAMVHFNSFSSFWVAENKKVLAMIQQQDFIKNLSKDQVDAINSLCPRTFLLSSEDRDLDKKINEIKNCKDDFVVKASIDTRARGVFIGKSCLQLEWDDIVMRSIDGPYVVQEYLPSKQENVSEPNSNNYSMMNSTIAMYLLGGKSSGLLCRSSTEYKTNFYSSGVFRPAYVVKNDK